MTTVDLSGELVITPTSSGHVVVRIPLAEQGPWTRHYLPLARADAVLAEVEEVPEGMFLVVRVPVGMSRQDTAEQLDAALGLVDKAKASGREQSLSVAVTEEHIRDWWARQRP